MMVCAVVDFSDREWDGVDLSSSTPKCPTQNMRSRSSGEAPPDQSLNGTSSRSSECIHYGTALKIANFLCPAVVLLWVCVGILLTLAAGGKDLDVPARGWADCPFENMSWGVLYPFVLCV